MSRAPGKRVIGALVALGLAGAVTGIAAAATHDVTVAARPDRAGTPGVSSHETGIQYAGDVIKIPAAAAHRDLVKVSPSGEFEFKHPSGSLLQLKAGKVMYLVGSDAEMVTRVTHAGGKLLVYTKPAALGQVIRSGKITTSGISNFAGGFVAPLITSSPSSKADDLVRPGYPYVGEPPEASAARGGAPVSYSIQGSSGHFGYSLMVTPSHDRLDVAGVICFQWGAICSTGPSNGLSLELNVNGYIDLGSESAAVAVSGGRITNSSVALKDMHAHLKLSYTGSRGEGPDSGGAPPVFRLPVGIDYTVPGLIPIYWKFQWAIIVKLGMSSKNTVMRGGVEYDSTDSDGIKSSGRQISGTSGSNVGPKGSLLDGEDGGTGSTVGLGAGGVVVALQFPKIGLGLGVRSFDAIGYLAMISSIGQTFSGDIAGGSCKYNFAWDIEGGFEAEAGPFAAATTPKILAPSDGKQFEHSFNAPSC